MDILTDGQLTSIYRDLGAISRPSIVYSHSPFSEVSGNQVLADFPLSQ